MSAKSSPSSSTASSGASGGASSTPASAAPASPAQSQAASPVQAAPASSDVQKTSVLPVVERADNKGTSSSNMREIRQGDILDEKVVTDDISTKTPLRQSLFGEKAPTREELMGLIKPNSTTENAIGEEAKAETGAASDTTTPEDIGAKKEGEGEGGVKAEGAKDDTKPDDTKPTDTEPQIKTVPLAALREVRGKMKLMSEEISNLRTALMDAEKRATGKAPVEIEPDFKVLTAEEERALFEEDAFEFSKYRDKKAAYEKATEESQAQERMDAQIIASARETMNTAVPGVLENKDGIGEELTAMAQFFGMEPEVLSILSEPSVRITLPGSKKSFPLGSAAVALVSTLNNIHGALKAMSEFVPADGKKVDMAALEQSITERVTKELMEKMAKTGEGFTSIGEVAGSSREESGTGLGMKSNISESDYLKMSKEDRRRALGG